MAYDARRAALVPVHAQAGAVLTSTTGLSIQNRVAAGPASFRRGAGRSRIKRGYPTVCEQFGNCRSFEPHRKQNGLGSRRSGPPESDTFSGLALP